MVECASCRRTIGVGRTATALDIKTFEGKVFCCKACCIDYIKLKAEALYEETAEEFEIEDNDPYATYGVQRGDF